MTVLDDVIKERDSLRAEVERLRIIIISAALRALPVGYLPNHTADKLRAEVETYKARLAEKGWQKVVELRAEVERLRAALIECITAVGGGVGERTSTDFLCQGPKEVRLVVERLRADANARAVEELRMQAEGCDKAAACWVREMRVVTDDAHRDRLESRINQLEGVAHHIRERIAELSKPAAKESEPVKPEQSPKCWSCGGKGYITRTSGVPGMIGCAHNSCSHCGGTGKLHYVTMDQMKGSEPVKPVTGPNYLDQDEWGHTKPEEPDWTVTLAAQAKKVLLGPAGPAHLACSLLVKVVEGLCHLGREVRRGGQP